MECLSLKNGFGDVDGKEFGMIAVDVPVESRDVGVVDKQNRMQGEVNVEEELSVLVLVLVDVDVDVGNLAYQVDSIIPKTIVIVITPENKTN